MGTSSTLTVQDYDTIKTMLLSGSTNTAIAKVVGISESSMSSAIGRLKWKEYNSGKKKS